MVKIMVNKFRIKMEKNLGNAKQLYLNQKNLRKEKTAKNVENQREKVITNNHKIIKRFVKNTTNIYQEKVQNQTKIQQYKKKTE